MRFLIPSSPEEMPVHLNIPSYPKYARPCVESHSRNSGFRKTLRLSCTALCKLLLPMSFKPFSCQATAEREEDKSPKPGCSPCVFQLCFELRTRSV